MKLITASKKILMPMCLALAVSTALTGCGEKSTEEHLSAAQGYLQQNNADAAIIEYKNAIKQDPKAAAPRFELGRLYLVTSQFEAAEKELNRALDLGHPASEVIPLLSQAYQRSGAENALVEMDYQVSGMSVDEQAEVGFYKLQALVELNKKQDALALVKELNSLDTDSIYKGLSQTYPDIMSEQYQRALRDTEFLRQQSPDNKDILSQLGRLYALTRQPEAAIDVYSHYVEKFPEDKVKQFALISLLIESRQMEQAKPYVATLLKQYPKNGLLNQYQGLIDSASGNYEAALSHLEKAIQSGQSSPAARLVAGFAAYQLKDYSAASQHLTMIASNLPDNHPGLRMLADALLRQGESEEASDILSRVGGDSQADAALFSKAGFQLLREGNVVDAKKMIERSGESSTSAEDLARLGVLQLSVNDVDGVMNLESALEQAPDNVATQKTLLAAYVRTNQTDKARELAQQWISNDDSSPIPRVYLAEVEMKAGNMEQAETLLNEAAQLAPEDRELALARIKFDVIGKQFDKARQGLQQLLNKSAGDAQVLALWYGLEMQQQQSAAPVRKKAEQALTRDPENLQLRLLVARMWFAENNSGKVLSTLESIQADSEAPPSFWNLKGQTLIRENRLSDAKNHYKKWVSLFPLDKSAVLGKLLLDDAQGRYEEAVATANSFLNKRPDNQVKVLKAYFLALQKKVKPAREVLDSLPAGVQALPFVRGVEARINLLDGRGDKALDDAKTAYADSPNAKNVVLVVASYESENKKQQAFDFLKQHYEKHPQDVRSTMLYAERLIRQSPAQAASVYNQVLEQLPDNFVVLNNLAYLYLEQGELKKAEPLARRAVAQQPKNAESVDTLAQILVKQNRRQEALSAYDRVDMDKVSNDEVYLNYVELLINADKRQLAQRRLQQREFTSVDSQRRVASLQSML
ncbi:XrtA/PEP-CTERM system TPR-repeat protein PrsT [Salinimonas lutimaris]|uniref:XrtA/PEP-CTERM system TPR-repeat protein PrsT n=1 Tax=Salinimonas lutimaris TaxID=914153 RepID=UPI0010C07E99|nr:XrtA/PEP-CTERM system TPR-repeat protein PrsT [Salinimonas lutimaris]